MIEETEIVIARRALPDAQAYFESIGSPNESKGAFDASWYGTSTSSETGCFVLVSTDLLDYEDFIGEVLELRANRHSVIVYCLGSADLPYDFGIARRAFLALAPLATEKLSVSIRVVE